MEFDLQRTIELLSATPSAVASLLGGLSDDWTSSASRDDWGPYDIIGHLIHAEHTDWIPRARVILDEGADRTFPPFDRFGHFQLSDGKQLGELLNDFAYARRESLETLSGWNLTDAQLSLTGVHPEFGNVTLGQLLATWAVHDMTHLRQIAASMAKRYETAVGPWKAYLSILK